MTDYNMFLDDERFFEQVVWIDYSKYVRVQDLTWIVCRTVDEAKHQVLTRGLPKLLSIDHDLGLGETADDFAKWLMDQDIFGNIVMPNNFNCIVHSKNPVGANNIDMRFKRYLRYKEEQ